MFKYALAIFFLISGALAGLYFFVGVPRVYREEFPRPGRPHVYDDSTKPISQIRVFAFYFVPQNKTGDIAENWREIFGGALEKLKKFHALQFQERSDLSFTIFPEPVIGERDNLFYDKEVTQYGNPRALFSVSEEIERRFFKFPPLDGEGGLPAGRQDLPAGQAGEGVIQFPPAFPPPQGVEETDRVADAYRVLLILYEGVGAVGGVVREDGDTSKAAAKSDLAATSFPGSVVFPVGIRAVDGLALLNRHFLTSDEYSVFGGSILAHEFYHTLGIPDAYEGEHAIPTSDDLMGLGRNRAIEKTYIQRDILKKMGL